MCNNILGIRNLYTTTFHPQTNGQVERFNRTILAALRKYVREERKTWDLFSHAVTYAYNTQTHASTGYPQFELVLSRAPTSLVIGNPATIALNEDTVKTVKELFAVRLRKMMYRADKNLREAQLRYKSNFDARMRPDSHDYSAEDQVFLRAAPSLQSQRPADKAAHENERGDRSHKLKPKVTGPFAVMRETSHTVTTVLDDNTEEVVSKDRVVLAPASLRNRTTPVPWRSASKATGPQEAPPTEKQFPEISVVPPTAEPTSGHKLGMTPSDNHPLEPDVRPPGNEKLREKSPAETPDEGRGGFRIFPPMECASRKFTSRALSRHPKKIQ